MRAALTLLFAAAACSSDSVFGVSVPGEPARVEWHRAEAAGGRTFESVITIDSATARYEVLRCEGSISNRCPVIEHRVGTVPPAILLRLFEDAQRREFRELKATYGFESSYLPPDPGMTTLTVVVGERSKVIAWSKHSVPPEPIREYSCLLLAAIEALLCD